MPVYDATMSGAARMVGNVSHSRRSESGRGADQEAEPSQEGVAGAKELCQETSGVVSVLDTGAARPTRASGSFRSIGVSLTFSPHAL